MSNIRGSVAIICRSGIDSARRPCHRCWSPAFRCAVERTLILSDQASVGESAVGAALKTVKHGLRPRFFILGGRRQLENRAIVAPPAVCCCAVERTLLIGEQASLGDRAVAAFVSETVKHDFGPSGLDIGRRRQFENRATANRDLIKSSTTITSASPATLRCCAVERALPACDQASPRLAPVPLQIWLTSDGRLRLCPGSGGADQWPKLRMRSKVVNLRPT
jgi:hypothetical protein